MIEFIVNPTSRGGQGAKIWKEVEAELKRLGKREGVEYRLHLTKAAKQAKQIAADLTSAVSDEKMVLVVLGGDGTLNEVFNGMYMGNPVRFGYIPTGTGNDFARSMELTTDIKQAVENITDPGYYLFLDYGVMQIGDSPAYTRRFAVSSGIGYDAKVCFSLEHSKTKAFLQKIHLQKLEYLLVGILDVFRSEPMYGTLEADGKKIRLERARFVSVHNHPYEGGGFCFAPNADPADGKLEICLVNHCGKGKFLCTLLLSLIKKHTIVPWVKQIRCEKARIDLTEAFPVHTDGETISYEKSVQFTCHKRKICLIAGK